MIITAGGIGKRMGGDIPKQFIDVAGKPVLLHTIALFREFNASAQILVTLPESWLTYWNELIEKHDFQVEHEVVLGGVERFHSIQNALQKVEGEFVLVHDGVRPLVSQKTLEKCAEALQSNNAVIPVVPVKESLRKISDDGSQAVNRADFRIVQTPQCFAKKLLFRAYTQDFHSGITDDSSLVEQLGEAIFCVEGNYENIKITTPEDLILAKSLLK